MKKPTKILGIESSCDETAVAIVEAPNRILANVVASQATLHARFGGVVPEVASRQHLLALSPLLDAAFSEAALSLQDIDAIAVTNHPGLIGALLTGVSVAKALAYTQKIPLLAIDHLEAHLFSAFLLDESPEFPFLGLAVSGGHSTLFLMESPEKKILLGQTRDDAAGEVIDKTAKRMGLGYPGGAIVDSLSESGDKSAFPLPRGMMKKPGFDFSFSGLKTAVRRAIDILESESTLAERQNDLLASMLEAMIDPLVYKAEKALKEYDLKTLVVAGGVAANRRLRAKFQSMTNRIGRKLFIPPIEFCTDNAAMVAMAGLLQYEKKNFAPLTLGVMPTKRG